MSKKVVIVGGVAGGMSCAARLKRLDDSLEVTVFEQGTDVSFANCGMPYYIGGIIADRPKMLVQTPQGLSQRYGLDIHVRHRVIRIDREKKEVEVTDLDSGKTHRQAYDYLVLSTGSSPIRPPIPGVDQTHVHVLNNLQDMDQIRQAAIQAKSVCVVGGGFIGLELVENFRHMGLEVHLVEMLDQVMPPFDWEMTQPLVQELKLQGVHLYLKETVQAISENHVKLASGREINTELVCLCAGVRPNSELAKQAGLQLGQRGHIVVNDQMCTNDSSIFAIGDVIETTDLITKQQVAIPLAGPANRQGRLVGDVICGKPGHYRQTQGTAIVKVFNQVAASTGLSEKRLKSLGWAYHKVYLHPTDHPRYYPNATLVSIKLLFGSKGEIYGAQIVGPESVDALINVFATALRSGLTVEDLEHLELAYSPQWGGAKDPVNMAGFVANNLLRGDVNVVDPDQIPSETLIVDCRTQAEAEAGTLPGALVLSVDELRSRLSELPRDKSILVYCAIGMRGYIAARYLQQQGYQVSNLNGGYRSWSWYQTGNEENQIEVSRQSNPSQPSQKESSGGTMSGNSMTHPGEPVKIDVSGLQCPGPMLQVKNAMEKMHDNQILEVVATDPGFCADIPMWCKRTGNQLLEVKTEQGKYQARIQKGSGTVPCSAPVETKNGKTIVCFSSDLDRVLATFVIANGAVAMGSAVTIFFTFWGLNVLRKENPPSVSKGFLDRMFGMMMPKGPDRLKLSKLNMGGMGTMMMKHVMRTKNVQSLPDLIQSAKQAGVRLVACSMSMDVMGLKAEELIEGVEIAGVGNYLGTADEASVNLFI